LQAPCLGSNGFCFDISTPVRNSDVSLTSTDRQLDPEEEGSTIPETSETTGPVTQRHNFNRSVPSSVSGTNTNFKFLYNTFVQEWVKDKLIVYRGNCA